VRLIKKKIKKNKIKKKREKKKKERERERDLLAKALKALNGNFRREIPWFMPVKI
jgi:type VI protein secretion system component VasK